MKVHLIFVTKYRKKIFKSDKRADEVKQFLHDVAKKQGYEMIQMETDKDHIHILLGYKYITKSQSNLLYHSKKRSCKNNTFYNRSR